MTASAPNFQTAQSDRADILAHLSALFPPGFVHPYADAQIEIAYGVPGSLDRAELFSAFRLEAAADFAVAKNSGGCNVYVGPTLKKGSAAKSARTRDADFLAGIWTWSDHDAEGDFERAKSIAKECGLAPGIVVGTGTVPHVRSHAYLKLAGGVTDCEEMRAINKALQKCLGGDPVQAPSHVMRLAGTVNYPTQAKYGRGYAIEPVTVLVQRWPHEHRAAAILGLHPAAGAKANDSRGRSGFGFDLPRSDEELLTLLEASRTPPGQWHNSMRNAIATMIGRGWTDTAIRLACAPYCNGGVTDPDLTPLIEGARSKWGKPNGDSQGGASQDGGGSQDASLPVIQITGGELSAVAVLGEEVLIAANAPVYQRGGKLVRPVVETVDATRGRQTNAVQLKILDVPYLRDLLCRHARWTKFDGRKGGLVTVDPPEGVAKVILARTGDWKFPAISGVISTPTMRPDGSLLIEPGYDKQTRLLLVSPPSMPPVPDNPTREDAEQALTLLESLLTGFPFSDDVGLAVALSAMITPVVRGAFPVAPLHAGRAPAAGSGKSFLYDTVAAISIGQPMPVISTGGSEQELEKRLGTAMMAGQPLISIDNITGELGGDALCQLIERPVVDVRILGRSESIRVEARGTTLFATGNNFVIVGDVCRRSIATNLDAGVERPELRRFDFDPVDRVLSDRGKYIAAALTICRAYLVAGRPNKAPNLGSFEGWSDTVRSALIWLGKADPVKSMEMTMGEDPEREELADMLEAWSDVLKTGSDTRRRLADVLPKAMSMTREHEAADLEPEFPDFHSAVMTVARRSAHGRAVQPDTKMLGKWLQKFKGRIINGKKFMCAPDAKRGNQWWVESLTKGGLIADSAEAQGERFAKTERMAEGVRRGSGAVF
jgi:phage gp37-like protein